MGTSTKGTKAAHHHLCRKENTQAYGKEFYGECSYFPLDNNRTGPQGQILHVSIAFI